jgi:MFS transporter, DHA1 family, inner membrane transport protein
VTGVADGEKSGTPRTEDQALVLAVACRMRLNLDQSATIRYKFMKCDSKRTYKHKKWNSNGTNKTSYFCESTDASRNRSTPWVNIRRVAPDGLIAAFILALLATAGIFYVNILPAIVSGLVEGLHFSASQAGRIAASNVYGAAAGAFFAVLVVRRIPWRRAAVFLLCGLIACDLTSTMIHSAGWLTVLRFLHGLTGGLLVGISYGVFSRVRSPDRCFGALMVVQASLGGLGAMFLPRLVPVYGAQILFFAMAALSIGSLILLPFLPQYPAHVISMVKPAPGIVPPPRGTASWEIALVIALLAVFFFQAGNSAVFAYMIELGRAGGLGLGYITTTLGVSNWIATVGAMLVIAFGTRWGRTLPIGVGTLAALVGNAAFHASSIPFVYAAANVASAITQYFALPYLLGLCAAFDRSGRAAALAGLFSKLGLATGPLAASFLVEGSSAYGSVVNLSIATLAISAVFGIVAARRADVRARVGAPALAV